MVGGQKPKNQDIKRKRKANFADSVFSPQCQ